MSSLVHVPLVKRGFFVAMEHANIYRFFQLETSIFLRDFPETASLDFSGCSSSATTGYTATTCHNSGVYLYSWDDNGMINDI